MTATRTQKLGQGVKEPRQIVQSLNRVIEGRLDCYGTVSLAAGVTTTDVEDTFVSENSTIVLSPRTANAAGALATTYVSAKRNGGFTLTHANAGTTDRTFDYAFIG